MRCRSRPDPMGSFHRREYKSVDDFKTVLKDIAGVMSPIGEEMHEAASGTGNMRMADMAEGRLRGACGKKADACSAIPVQTAWDPSSASNIKLFGADCIDLVLSAYSLSQLNARCQVLL